MPTCIRSSVILEVRDVVKSSAFYIEKLGFGGGNLWGEPPCFSIVGRGTVTVMLDQRRNDEALAINQYWAAYIYVDDVEGLLQEFRSRGVEAIRGPEDQPYGCRDFDIKDLDGHILAFGQDLQPGPDGPGL